jgi:hypothetical protein
VQLLVDRPYQTVCAVGKHSGVQSQSCNGGRAHGWWAATHYQFAPGSPHCRNGRGGITLQSPDPWQSTQCLLWRVVCWAVAVAAHLDLRSWSEAPCVVGAGLGAKGRDRPLLGELAKPDLAPSSLFAVACNK